MYNRPGTDDAVWEKASIIKNKDPTIWRKCFISKRIIKRQDRGHTSEYGWDVDHYIPKSNGGSDDICNLVPVHYIVNRSMGSSFRLKPDALLKFHDAIREKRNIPKIKSSIRWSSIIGRTVWVRPIPCCSQKMAKVLSYNNQFVEIKWTDSNWIQNIPLDKNLFELIDE